MRSKILYVDDEESNLRVFKSAFRRKYEVFIATSAKKGIEILEKQQIDIILSDQRMPEMTGVEFLKYAVNHYPYSIRMLVTGYADFEAMKNAINQAQIIHYIQKPWDELELSRVIENTLKIRHLEKENFNQKKELIITAVEISKTSKILNQTLKQLNKLIEKQENEEACHGLADIQKTLQLEIKKQDSWELFEKRFLEVHPVFFSNLKTAHPDITKTEMRYITYLRINMSLLQITSALNVTVEAIKKTRYRLRKKIGINADLSLEDYILRF